jgi:general stress protein 26
MVDLMNEDIKEKLNNLFNEQRFAVIATQGKYEPYTNLVSFLAGIDLRNIYFPTSKNTKKYENLSEKSRISILIDNRVNKPIDIKNAIAVTAIGKSKQTKDKYIFKLFLKKHPYLKDFVNSMDCIMIEIEVEKYILINNFQKINIIDF